VGVLDADNSGILNVSEVRAFIMALTQGAEQSLEPERVATQAFVAELESLLEGRASCSRRATSCTARRRTCGHVPSVGSGC
jgi:hypothetical protein